jgi:hypothetical protein
MNQNFGQLGKQTVNFAVHCNADLQSAVSPTCSRLPVRTTHGIRLFHRFSSPPSVAHGRLQTLTEGLPASAPVAADVSSAPISNDAQPPATDANSSLQTLTEGLPASASVAADVSSAPISNDAQPPATDANSSLQTLTEGLSASASVAADVTDCVKTLKTGFGTLKKRSSEPSPRIKMRQLSNGEVEFLGVQGANEFSHSLVSSAPISNDAQLPATDANSSLQTLTEGLPIRA